MLKSIKELVAWCREKWDAHWEDIEEWRESEPDAYQKFLKQFKPK